MTILEWFSRRDRWERRNFQRRIGPRRRRRSFPLKHSVASLKENVEQIHKRLEEHDTKLVELSERSSTERLEQLVSAAVQRWQSSLSMPTFVRRAMPQPVTDRAITVDNGTRVLSPATGESRWTPTQALVLQAMAAEPMHLSYADIGQLIHKSPTAVKYQINLLKQRGIQFDSVVGFNNQVRYRLTPELKQLVSGGQ